MKYIIFDIDDVLADCSHRLKYIKGEKKDYDKFYSYGEVLGDKIIDGGWKMFWTAYHYIEYGNEYSTSEVFGRKIAILTARNEKCRKATKVWFEDNFGIIVDEDFEIFMGPSNDWRPAHQVKEDLIKKHIGFENILFAFDDDDKINEMYAKHGVMCYKPNIIKK